MSSDPVVHEEIVRDVLRWTSEMDLAQSPPAMAQRIHRKLRKIVGVDDPYREVKDRFNCMVMEMLPRLSAEVEQADDPLLAAARFAIIGNVIDMGVYVNLTQEDIQEAVSHALTESFYGEAELFRHEVKNASSILYLADNAGEIAFDRLLIEQILQYASVTLAVRGAPVINDATLRDAVFVGLDKLVPVIGNGSDAPGTILSDCSQEFRSQFLSADLIIAKGQGNYESLSHEHRNLFFLFKVKCPVISDHVKQPVGTQIMLHSTLGIAEQAEFH